MKFNRSVKELTDLEATQWVARFDRGLTNKEQEEFLEWLRKSSENGEAFQKWHAEWEKFDLLEDWRPLHSKEVNPNLLAKDFVVQKNPRIKLSLMTAVAALLMISLISITLWNLNHGEDESRYLASGKAASEYELHKLSDGSVVELNKGSQVRTDFSKKLRRLELVSGEAFFTVQKDFDRPFLVSVNGMVVRAIGTAFSVNLKNDSLEVMVTEGVVRLDKEYESPISKDFIESETACTNESTPIVAGQKAVQGLNGIGSTLQIESLEEDDVETYLSWKNWVLRFESTPLEDVISEFNKRNATQIKVRDRELLDTQVTVIMKADNVDGFVQLLELAAGVSATQEGPEQIVIKAR